MAGITRIPCEGVIYTVREDAYGSTIETDEAAGVLAGDADGADEHTRYAQVLAELDELEETLTEAEAQASRADQIGNCETDEDEDSFPLL